MQERETKAYPVVAYASLAGFKHDKTENEDFADCRILPSGSIIAAVADGVGSLKDSYLFSRAAVRAVIESFTPILIEWRKFHSKIRPLSDSDEPNSSASGDNLLIDDQVKEEPEGEPASTQDETILSMHEMIFNRALDEFSLLDGFEGSTTLQYSILIHNRLHWGMIGDGAIVIVPRNRRRIQIVEMEEKEFTFTYVVDADSLNDGSFQSGEELVDKLEAVIMMTDGVLDSLDDPANFIFHICSEIENAKPGSESDILKNIIAKFPEVHGDDKSIVLIKFRNADNNLIDVPDINYNLLFEYNSPLRML